MRFRSTIALLALFAAVTASAAPPDQKLQSALPQIEKLFTTFAEKQHLPGAAMGIIVGSDLVWLKTTGLRDVEAQAPVTPETVFRIASMTKSFTAMSILKLRDAGKLSLDDPASKYVPELAKLAYLTHDSPIITIRHLLTHSEGFPEDNPWGDRQLARSDATLAKWERAGIPFSTAPGTAYEYSNYGFAILGQIVQRVAKQPYADYVRDSILRPLGMTSTTFFAKDVPATRKAKGYKWDSAKKSWTEEPALEHGAFGAMGGLWTTPHDLARYVSFLMSAFPPRDDPESGPIRRSSAREMQQAWRSSGAAFATRETVDSPLQFNMTSYGYGLSIAQDCRFAYMVQHGGGLPGYGSIERWLPDYGVGVIAFGNVTYASFRPLLDEVLGAMLAAGALERRPVQPSPALLQAKNNVTSLIQKWDDQLANAIATDNLFLDESAASRKENLDKLAAAHGACRAASSISAENALRGTWEMPCERGALQVRITLAPTMPPQVQYLSVRSIMPPTASAREAIEASMSTIPPQWGKCVAADAVDESSLRMNCERGALIARVAEGKVTFSPVRDLDHRCAP